MVAIDNDNSVKLYFNNTISDSSLDLITQSLKNHLEDQGISLENIVPNGEPDNSDGLREVSLTMGSVKIKRNDKENGSTHSEIREHNSLKKFFRTQVIASCHAVDSELGEHLKFTVDPHGNIGFQQNEHISSEL